MFKVNNEDTRTILKNRFFSVTDLFLITDTKNIINVLCQCHSLLNDIALNSVLLILHSPIQLTFQEISMGIIPLSFLIFYKHYATANLKTKFIIISQVKINTGVSHR